MVIGSSSSPYYKYNLIVDCDSRDSRRLQYCLQWATIYDCNCSMKVLSKLHTVHVIVLYQNLRTMGVWYFLCWSRCLLCFQNSARSFAVGGTLTSCWISVVHVPNFYIATVIVIWCRRHSTFFILAIVSARQFSVLLTSFLTMPSL